MERYLIKRKIITSTTVSTEDLADSTKGIIKKQPPSFVSIEDPESSGSSVDDAPMDERKKRKKKQSKTVVSKKTQSQALRSQVSKASTSSSFFDQIEPAEKEGRVNRTKKVTPSKSNSDTFDSSASDHEKARTDSKKSSKKWYRQKFKSEWQSSYSWLEPRAQAGKPISFCKPCQKIIKGGRSHLERHAATDAHQSNFKTAQTTVAMRTFLDGDGSQRLQNRDRLVKSAEMKMVMFLHEHNLPFILMDHLPKFMASVCPDSEVAKALKCGRTKSKSLTECIAAEQMHLLSEKLKESMFSIIIDETTDIGTEKSLAIVVRFYDNGQCIDSFIGLIKVTSCGAADLFNAVTKHLRDLGIPIPNMLGFAADNASVMMGNISGVQARFKEILPHLFVLGCVCHSFHLCSSAAAHELPRSVEELIRSIYNYFAHSSNRLHKLKEFQAFVDLKPHKLLRPCQTRWLSVQAAVDRVMENWEALILFFTNECFEDNLPTTHTILSQLKSPAFKIYFAFLSYILDIVNRLNLEFQAERPKLHLLLSRVGDLYRNILRNFITKDHLDRVSLQRVEPSNSQNFLPLEKIYFGAKTDILLQNEKIDPKDVHDFKTRSLSFYIVLSQQIRKRFDFENPILLFVSYFNPKTALLGEIPSIATEALKLFPQLVNDVEKLNSEWRLLPDLAELQAHKNEDMLEFWSNIFKMLNELKEPMFPNLGKLVKGILCLPHSSAAAERVFSQLNLIKTKARNRLYVSTCDNILHAKQLLGVKNDTCHSWEPSSSLLNRKYQCD